MKKSSSTSSRSKVNKFSKLKIITVGGLFMFGIVIMYAVGQQQELRQHASEATRQIMVKQSTINNHSCDTKEWHFVINQVSTKQLAPTFIEISWGAYKEILPLTKFSGKVAHYTTTSHLNSKITNASAKIYSSWNGQFNLSHGPCGVPDYNYYPSPTKPYYYPVNPTATPYYVQPTTPKY